MNTTRFFATGFLGIALCGATLKTASAAPNTQRPIVVGPIIKSDRTLPQAGTLFIGEPIPLMTEMLDYARTGHIARGTKTAVYATVTITSAASGFTASNSRISYANGELSLGGKKGAEYFEGRLRIAHNSGNAAAPFHTSRGEFLKLRIYRNGRVSATYSVPIKKVSNAMSFVSDGADGFLWGRDADSKSLISVAFAKSVSGATTLAPANTSTPHVSTSPPPSGPRGMKVRVTPSFVIMNSDDGIGFFKKDMTIELFGSLYLGNKKSWSRSYSNELSATKGNVILGESVEAEIFYDNPASWRLKVNGSLQDSDKPSVDDDIVWQGNENVDLKAAVEQQNGRIVLKGQADDEYADLRLKVEKIADIN